MEYNTYNQFLARIRGCSDPALAKDIDTDILVARHDYFGRELCKTLDIEYRNDIPLVDILLEVKNDFDPLSINIPLMTPDNYLVANGKLFIIDYKVSVSRESSIQTLNKYTGILEEVCPKIGIDFEIAIVRANPITSEITFSSDEFRNLFGALNFDLDFSQFLELKRILYEKFADNEEFLLKVSHGDFTITAPWCKSGVKDLERHPIMKDFKKSLPFSYRRLFEESIRFNPYQAEKWNMQLIRLKEYTAEKYHNFIKDHTKKIFECTGNFERPSSSEIQKGWIEMTERMNETRILSTELCDQKPSAHFIWSKPDENYSNNNIQKLLRLSKSLQQINGVDTIDSAFKSIGLCMDFSDNIEEYNSICIMRKNEARKYVGQVQNKKIEPVKIGKSLIYWEQQFGLSNENFEGNTRVHFMKDYCGIGKHKNFKNKMLEDLELDKPKILDFNDDKIYLSSKQMIEQTSKILNQESNLDINKDFIYKNFKNNILESSEKMLETLETILSSKYWSCINDISILIKNIISISQYNRHNTFRVATSPNNNLFGILMPSTDIKSKRSTVVYFIITLHKEKDSVLNPGCLYKTYKTKDGYISISKAIRLDKERCQRLVSSPGLFLLTTTLFKYYSPDSSLSDIMPFSFYTSVSITKSLLTLTEPARYMIMNSLATSSHVREYISEKFSPNTKTLFSVYVTRKIKNACFTANKQREKIQLRNISLTDYDITQKGVEDNTDFDSIWFPGKVSLKGYINQIYLPFYFNAKGLHEKHHVMIDLAKTVLEIEKDQRINCPIPWSEDYHKQSVNLPIFLHSLAKNLILDTSRHNHLRSKIENKNNFNRSITTISTFTSSKSCIKIGDYQDLKEKIDQTTKKAIKANIKRTRVANNNFITDEEIDNEIKHSNYTDLRKSIPDYRDYISTKVFDRLYELLKLNLIDGSKTAIQNIMSMMLEHKEFYFTFFNKGQKTAKDREIFVGEFEAKMCMYAVERISKERCKLNPDEMISEPGDSKMKVLEQKAEQEIRYIIEQTRQKNKNLEMNQNLYKATKIEINADMSKWSAQDVFYKYFWLIALDPILYPAEKERIIYFLCNYMEKRLILPDELLCNILDQRKTYSDDIISEMTNMMSSNYVNIKRNWLQGNFNYTSSYVHSCAMSVYKDIIKEISQLIEGDVLINSLVHSDDNHTSITYIHDRLDSDILIEHAIETFEKICLAFGCQANMKKTYINNVIKEFVSLFCISGEPFSIFGRFLLTSVGDCAYIGPYEDMASRLTSTQTAIKHGCPPSLAWLSIAVNHWMTFTTYNMLPGQVNDPLLRLPCKERTELPIELFGILNADLSTIALIGLESSNITFLTQLIQRMSPIDIQKESIIDQCVKIPKWDLRQLSESEIFRLKIMRYLILDSEIDVDSIMGETSEMRGRSLITPRKFTTIGSLKKLISFNDYQQRLSQKDGMEEIFEFLLNKPELLVTKGEEKDDYMNSILFRYNSKKFKESLSIQNSVQLFIEQILFSHKPVIDYSGIRDKYSLIGDNLELEENPTIIGRMTFNQTYEQLSKDLAGFKLDNEDINLVYQFMILNDPLLITVANSILFKINGIFQKRTGLTCNNMPELRNLKLIHHSPALVLRAYSRNTPDIPGCEIEEMRRDLIHLEEFIEKTKLKEKMDQRIINNQMAIGMRDLKFELSEYTRFYQICYEYVKSTEHKVKVFILPCKAYTTIDFCSILQGNLLRDDEWVSIHYLKNITAGGYKAIVQKTNVSEINTALEAIRLLAYFTDTFVNNYSKKQFIQEVIDKFTYKNVPISKFYEILLNSHLRHEIIPFLFITGHLNQKDLDKYDAMKTAETITWNNWQINRSLQTGPIDLKISAHNKSIRIIGADDLLQIAELQVTRMNYDNIILAGRRLLMSRHGLKFETFKKIQFQDEIDYYITYQKKGKNQFAYQIHNKDSIIRRNTDNLNQRTRYYNEIVPVCPLLVAEMQVRSRINIRQLNYLNHDENYAGKIKIDIDEYIVMRRVQLYKMQNFEGPDIKSGLINFRVLMKTPELLNTNYNKISQSSILSFSRILTCTGNKYEDTLEFLSDEPLDIEEESLIESTPIFSVTYMKKGKKNMSYKSAIEQLILNGVEEIENVLDFSKNGFVSNENLGILEVIVSSINLLNTNEWSTMLLNCLHIALIKNGYDAEFHMFNMPDYFLENKIEFKVDWIKLREFIITLPDLDKEPWNSMFQRFKEKAINSIDKEVKKTKRFTSYLEVLKKRGGRSMFDFE
uniref:RNA-directed RNA polymerase L n=1 Tax=Wuhan Louse Fly Virus 1 TaxID=1608113 RepID=A0A0B5KXU2_9VIRU|nr:RNA-dependent RNA polymerase [Wuhan Louse Fly Virus 1]